MFDPPGPPPPPHPGPPPPGGVGISVAAAIVLGLIASFIQSLGLTIQRKSHLQNETLPVQMRRSEWKRPLWLLGFVIFISANISGTVFQIGALPIVMLAPLGAVSLLYNALLARILLNDIFSQYMIAGTLLIAGGAVLIGYFGTVPDHPHSLSELLDLYTRPPFVAFMAVFSVIFFGVLALAHLAEWQLYLRLNRKPLLVQKNSKRHKGRKDLRRRWSAPTLAPLAEVNENPSGIATPILAIVDEAARRGLPADRLVAAARERGLVPASSAAPAAGAGASSDAGAAGLQQKTRGAAGYGSITSPARPGPNGASAGMQTTRSHFVSSGERARRNSGDSLSSSGSSAASDDAKQRRQAEQARADADVVRRTTLGLSIAYGGASGTLSGVCLLLAKSGVELLVLTFAGQNQFRHWQSWGLVGVMIVAALAQLWYLNKSLRLSDPTIVCPLAFCFYNTSSIALGLVYFDQVGALRWWEVLLVAVGTALLLLGVWVVSLHSRPEADADEEAALCSVAVCSPIDDGSGVSGAPGVLPGTNFSAEPDSLLSPVRSDASAGVGAGEVVLDGVPGTPTSPVSPGTHARGRRRSPSLTLGVNTLAGVMTPEESDAWHARHGHGHGSGIYSTFLERGFSVGIAASSPGFHLQPTQHAGGSSGSSSRVYIRPSGTARRAMSEADLRPLPDTSHVTDDEADALLVAAAAAAAADNSSAFRLDLPSLDVQSLRLRLGQLQLNRSWDWLGRLLGRPPAGGRGSGSGSAAEEEGDDADDDEDATAAQRRRRRAAAAGRAGRGEREPLLQ